MFLGKYGVEQPWYFCLSPKYWCKCYYKNEPQMNYLSENGTPVVLGIYLSLCTHKHKQAYREREIEKETHTHTHTHSIMIAWSNPNYGHGMYYS